MAMTGGTAKLVKTTYPFSDSSKAVSLYIYYKTSQDITNNRSTITCGMYVTTPSGWDIGQWDDWDAASYVGTTSNTFDGTIPNFSGTRWIAENKTFTVDHNADGTGKATIRWKWAVNSPWGGYVNPSGSFSITLPQIPRATVPTLSATSVQMGKDITISMPRASSSFTHTLAFTINGTTGTIASGLGTSYTWTIPKTLVQRIPNKLSSAVTITCETYSGTTKVGSKTVSFTATVPSASAPTASASSVQMGKAVTITTNRETSYYTHTIEFTLNGVTGEIATGVGASYSWTVPNLMSLIPNATSGTATITCTTYNGTAKVGAKTTQVKITAYDATTPTVTTVTGNLQMGETITIGTPRLSEKYTHQLLYSIGEKTGRIADDVKESQTWEIPMSIISEVKNATSGTVSITCITKNGTATIGTKYLSVSVQVPDASIPSINTTRGIMGESLIITTNRKVSQYTHILEYTFGGETIVIPTKVGDLYIWEVPLTLAAKIPNAVSDLVTIRCITYNGTALVGTESCSITLSVPDNDMTKPNFTMAFTPVHSLSDVFDDMFIQGKSMVSVTFSANSGYADIKSFAYKIGGVTKYGNSAVSDIIVSSGSVAIEGTVTDSRGYSRTITEYINVIPYSKPRIVAYSGESSVICTRSSSDGTIDNKGEYVLIRAGAAYSKVVSNNTQHNFCRIHYRYKTASADDYNNWVELDGTNVSHVIDNVFNVKTAYTLQLKAEDDVGDQQTYTYIIKALRTPLHLGEGGLYLGLGQFCDYSEDERIDVGWKTYFNTGIGRKVIFEVDDVSSGWNSGDVLNDIVPEADTTMVEKYNLFIATVKTGVAGEACPVLCVRHNNIICGISDLIQLRITRNSDNGFLSLSSITNGYAITSLYALL